MRERERREHQQRFADSLLCHRHRELLCCAQGRNLRRRAATLADIALLGRFASPSLCTQIAAALSRGRHLPSRAAFLAYRVLLGLIDSRFSESPVHQCWLVMCICVL